MKLRPYTSKTYLSTFPMVMLMVEMMMLALVRPNTMVIALPNIGMKAKKPIQACTACHESFSLVEFLLLHVQIFLYPLHLSESSHAIIKQ